MNRRRSSPADRLSSTGSAAAQAWRRSRPAADLSLRADSPRYLEVSPEILRRNPLPQRPEQEYHCQGHRDAQACAAQHVR
jgi:hypothetical protein